MEGADSNLGLTTKEALKKLRDDINNLVKQHKNVNRISVDIIKNIISFSSEKVLLSGVAYTITIIYILCLVLTFFIGKTVQAHPALLWEALLLLIILIINFLLALNEQYLYKTEVIHRAEKVVETLENAIGTVSWREKHYPHLCAPFSPCVTLQWTYRDGCVVNLPWALLVEGDVVLLRPGQEVPGHCKGVGDGDTELLFGQIYQPLPPQAKEHITLPRIRVPLENSAYRMCETPYLNNLRIALRLATQRPVTVFEKQRYLCTVKIMEGIVLPLVVFISVSICLIRHTQHLPSVTHWTEIFLLQTVATTLPLLQIVFPIAWIALNCFGLARFKLLSEVKQKYVRPKSHSISEDASDPLIQALSESNINAESLKSLSKTFLNILLGREDMVCRTSNIVHVLGSLSALCCVDKKGILSWPNPTAEKVFFLHDANTSPSHHSSNTSVDSDGKSESATEGYERKTNYPATVAEVLDLTHDQNAPFCVEFDSASWRTHLARLKPLGLAALMNTCHQHPNNTYAHFCAHLTCEAQLSEDLVPVTNRRCLCELAKQIGFSEAAVDGYTVQQCLAIFRHLQADTIRRETKFVRSLQLQSRVKVPLPHMLAVLVTDQSDSLQMLTQGTADIIVDSCVDYWNGRELTPLSAADRKRIIDFYQRNSLTAYCTAFAYKPLSRGISDRLAATYLQLPADSRQAFAPLSQRWAEMPALHFHSTDSLIFNEVVEEEVDDVEGYFEMQCNQVFIGMVTMQYQAQSDMVDLIERLERACIRFVHFSKENELRSRVFSEKMGLESGWNCHISLMSDENPGSGSPESSQCVAARARASTNPPQMANRYTILGGLCDSSNMRSSRAISVSAPGAINLEHSSVKFHSETTKPRHSITTHHSNIKYGRGSVVSRQESNDSLLDGSETALDACRSLSCLTDSTDHSAPVPFDMSNRAKLPRGIENIRPHIEQVDNVPLLVSLFTDCTPDSVQSMLHIMQEYGEVVCVLGSSANCRNMELLMQADASIAVEPLYPVLCQKMPPYELPEKCVGPIDLARTLNSVPCSLSMSRDADISLFTLITMSRHYMCALWNCTQFWLCAACFIAGLQIGSLLSFLPLAVSAGGAIWSSVAVVPPLAASLAFAPIDPPIMQRAATRYQTNVNFKMALFMFWCYACKFIPSMISILTLYWYTLRSFCEQIGQFTNSTECWIVYPQNLGGNFTMEHDLSRRSFHGWGDDFYDGFYMAQHVTLGLITLHLIVISISFIHRQSSIWHRGFWTNKMWCFTVVLILISQSIFSASLLSYKYGLCERWNICDRQYHIGWPLVLAYLLSPCIIFGLNEFIKWQEIKADTRNQRRARLDFGTKLGMNSPF